MLPEQSYYQTPESVVVGFYNLLNDKQHVQAFDCMTPDLQQQRWGGDAAYFAKGYAYTLAIQNPTAYKLTQNENTAEILAHYTDHFERLTHPDMDNMHGIKIGQFGDVLRNMRSFNSLMMKELDIKIEDIENIPVSSFFTQNNIETCLWLTKTDYNKNDELFTREAMTLNRARIATTIYTPESGWKIGHLKALS